MVQFPAPANIVRAVGPLSLILPFLQCLEGSEFRVVVKGRRFSTAATLTLNGRLYCTKNNDPRPTEIALRESAR